MAVISLLKACSPDKRSATLHGLEGANGLLPELKRKVRLHFGSPKSIPISLMGYIPCSGKRGLGFAAFPGQVPTHVVGVQVGKKDGVDVFGAYPRRRQRGHYVPVDARGESTHGAWIGGIASQSSIHQYRLPLRAKQHSPEMRTPGISSRKMPLKALLVGCP